MRLLAVLTVAVLAATLAGCGPGRAADDPEPQPTVTEEPLFATDAEALAAAEKVYREYSELARAISSDGGNGSERLIPVTTSNWFEQEKETYRRVRDSGNTTVGDTPLITFVLQERHEDSLIAYACHDYSDLHLINAEQVDVTPQRERFVTFEVSLIVESDGYRIDRTEVWSVDAQCSN